jgi:hypothetical protein
VDFLVERLNFDADYMQVMCPDRQRYEKVMLETSAAVATDLMRAIGSTPAPVENMAKTERLAHQSK